MSRAERVAGVAGRYVQDEKFSGIEWQVDVGGAELTRGRIGFADHAARTPIPEGALYRIFSMTKPVVSVLALILMEQGRLRLYDMLPQFDTRFANLTVLTADGAIQPAMRPVTVEDLLTHRAGFTYEFIHGCHVAQYYREARINADGSRSLDEMMGVLATLPLAFQPGSRFRYSVSTDVLAHVIERATGRRLDDLLREELFGPLGMVDTGFTVPAEASDRLMPMFGVGDLTGAPPPLQPLPQVLVPMDVDEMYPVRDPDNFRRGGLGLYSTLTDYAAFARMLLDGETPDGGRLLSRKTHEMLQVNRLPAHQLPLTIGPNVLAGYGWGLIGRVLMNSGHAVGLSGSGEFGWAGAASTYFWVDPLESMTGVIMTQFLGASLPLADDMRSAAYQMLE